MATERIIVNSQEITTLKELLRPGLEAVFVGLNPSNGSVKKGHYYQGRLGRRFWQRLRECNIMPALAEGAEDDDAFMHGYGFADLVRRPTGSGKELSKEEKLAAAPNLLARLSKTGDRPAIVFVYREARKFAGPALERMGYRLLAMPAPYATKEEVFHSMKGLRAALNRNAQVKRATDD
ncbi:MAG TPA: uracil-DNA glycosylase family protein [Terriglobia bacterium]|nr:uracil-DNA glycosylase family protein [Terriglobia bacterium]